MNHNQPNPRQAVGQLTGKAVGHDPVIGIGTTTAIGKTTTIATRTMGLTVPSATPTHTHWSYVSTTYSTGIPRHFGRSNHNQPNPRQAVGQLTGKAIGHDPVIGIGMTTAIGKTTTIATRTIGEIMTIAEGMTTVEAMAIAGMIITVATMTRSR